MEANYVQRLRLFFRKQGPARFIGHLDVARTLERALLRARIPVSYSQGFNPRPRMQMAAPLPLGYTSEYELADIWLTEAIRPELAQRQMMETMAPGLDIYRVEEVSLSEPALQTRTTAATYVATLLDPVDVDLLQSSIDALLAADSWLQARRRGKSGQTREYDLRPLILSLRLVQEPQQLMQIIMELVLAAQGAGRPDEVLKALGLDPLAARFQRTMITLGDGSS